MDKMIMMAMIRWWLIIDNKHDYVADSDDNEDMDDDDDEEQEYGQLCGAFEKYKFGKQSRWQYRLPIIVPSSVQPLHSHLPRKKVIVLMRMMMMVNGDCDDSVTVDNDFDQRMTVCSLQSCLR